MSRVCILTDSTAQFPIPGFPGKDLVTILPLQIQFQGQVYADSQDLNMGSLPLSNGNGTRPSVLPPAPELFRQTLVRLGYRYHHAILILVSAHLLPVVQYAQEAAAALPSPITVHILDSQTTAAGLGFLVQVAAEAAQSGLPAFEITRLLRGVVPHIYTLFCLQNLTHLSGSGQLDPAQALVGEMLGITPFLMLEKGCLIPIQKARSARHLTDIFCEFASEFHSLRHLALLEGLPPLIQETRTLRDRIANEFPTTPFSEHTLGAVLEILLGPRCLGLVAMEETQLQISYPREPVLPRQ